MTEIPPPLIPDPAPGPPGGNDVLYIPFLLADAPRLQLEFLARHKGLTEAQRDSIKAWVRGYNTRLLKWIHDNYGPEAVRAADAMSRRAADKMNENAKLAQEQVERDLFNHLEQEFDRDE